MTEIMIVGEGGRVRIQVAGYERQAAENLSDANWLNCNVSVDVPPFSGRYDAAFSTQDFVDFSKQLGVLSEGLAGEAVFQTDEGALHLRLVMQSRGGLTIDGEAVAVMVGRTALKFKLLADQSHLSDLRRAVQAVSTEFPVRAAGGAGGTSGI